MSHRSASNVRLSKRVERGVREVRAAVAQIHDRRSTAPLEIITSDHDLTQAEADALKREWEAQYVGGRSEAAEGEVIVVTREDGSAAASSSVPLSGNSEMAVEGTNEAKSSAPARTLDSDVLSTASPNNPGAATVPSSGNRQRDPRLGRYANVGAFLTHCLQAFHMDATAVWHIADRELSNRTGGKRRLAIEMADYPGGLDALYEECERQTASKEVRA